MSNKRKIVRKDGSVVIVTTTGKGEYICEGYDPENDIAKSHEEIVCKVAEKDLELEELLKELE
jgi:hypothetical protein